MFEKVKIIALVPIFILFLAGCGASLSGDGGIEPTEVVDLDGEFSAKVNLEKGQVVALDMRIPKKSGYKLVGASFDPQLLRMVHYLIYDDDGQPRAQYMFQAEADGSSDVLIKMQPEAGGDVEIYKQITVMIGKKKGLF